MDVSYRIKAMIKNGFNRRFKVGLLSLVLITVSFYICLFLRVDLTWFEAYSKIIGWICGAVILGLSVTDSLFQWTQKK
ncbi:MAG: hypothetical protein NC828_01605 [Candidatus Omnitrophica bacterium]|nr:hypothetical protein [Candidatus Omnitrophota bacterium]